jgi:serine phosphatase RsbU (regulator of sigma subunit)
METLKIHEKRNDKEGLIMDYANIGGFSYEERDFMNAEKNYLKAIELAIIFKDSVRLNTLFSSMGMLAEKQNKLDESINYFNIGLKYITQKVSRETIMQYYKRMSDVYVRQKKYQEALQSYTLYKAWSDSAFNVNETKKQTELKLNYEFEQTQKKIEAENKAKELLSKAELEQERKQRNLLLIGLGIISLMLIITVKNYRAKQKANTILHKQKLEIERQKKIVDEKNHEISDSINYALRIQTASIPKLTELDTFFKDYDLFFKPKDVVSGDFYWAEKTSDFSLIAVGDCTGHGVPGAITSMIGSMLLNEIFNVKKIYQPDEVLTELNRLVKLTLRQDSASLTNDGMDIAFCTINYNTLELLYSGANRPLYIIKSNGQFIEYKPTKMSIGGQVALIQQYELHKIQLQKGDTIVLSTDGYADQFGGNHEKKFTSKALRNLISQHHLLSSKELKNIIETNYYNWKGDFEQTDDVLVFILKV